MIDSIKLYQILDEVKERKDILHPAVRDRYTFKDWTLLCGLVGRDSANILLHMSWGSMVRIRYKWFRRVVDILNKSAKGSGIVFDADVESFECKFSDRHTGDGGGVGGYLTIHAFDQGYYEYVMLGGMDFPTGQEMMGEAQP